jgi:hypothetical protein
MVAPANVWHRKAESGLCSVCGVGGKCRKGVTHRAHTADEAFRYRAPYVKSVKVAFGQDTDHRLMGWEGQEVHPNQARFPGSLPPGTSRG